MPHSQNMGTAATGVSKAAPGRVYAIIASNANAAVRYFQLHDKATTPVNGDVPVLNIAIPAGSAAAPAFRDIGATYFGNNGLPMNVGVSWAVSTTAANLTAATAAEHTVSLRVQ